MEYSFGPIAEYAQHNDALEKSEEFQRINKVVTRELNILYAQEQIKMSESMLKSYERDKQWSEYKKLKSKIDHAKNLISSNPEEAADLFLLLGCCHWFWENRKNILKEKYGITWYTPAEINPHIKFD